MSYEVKTPITQAMNEGAITRKELKKLMVRSNKPALIRLMIWICLLSISSSLIYLSIGTWFVIPSMFIQGIILVHHFQSHFQQLLQEIIYLILPQHF